MKYFLFFSIFLLSFYGYSQSNYNGALDFTFNNYDTSSFNFVQGPNGKVKEIIKQPDGKYILMGEFSYYDNTFNKNIARINPDLTLDTTFNQSEIYPIGETKTIALQNDGKLLVGGYFYSFNGIQTKLIRLNPNGLIDNQFNTINLVNTISNTNAGINDISIQSDGKIIIVGDFTECNGNAANNILRLNSDGSIDTTFNVTGTDGQIVNIALDTTNDFFYILGAFNTYNTTNVSNGLRLQPNGNIDTTYNIDLSSYFINIASSIKLIDNQLYLLTNNKVHRFNNDGSIDSSFYQITTNGNVYNVTKLMSNELLISGEFTQINGHQINKISKASINGDIDTNFVINNFSNDIHVIIETSPNTLLIGGDFTKFHGFNKDNLIHISIDGVIQDSYIGLDNPPIKLIVQPDNKILLITEAEEHYNSYSLTKGVCRLLENGKVDSSFLMNINNCSFEIDTHLDDFAIQNDGKILLAGGMEINNTIGSYLIRINQDGTYDSTFTPVDIDGIIYSIVVQDDNKILIAGTFDHINSFQQNHIARINTDGTIDFSFSSPFAWNLNISKIILSENSPKIYVITSPVGITNNLYRLFSNGQIDNSFNNYLSSFRAVDLIELQNNNLIVVYDPYLNGVPKIMRLNNNGSFGGYYYEGFTNCFLCTGDRIKKISEDLFVLGAYETGINDFNLMTFNSYCEPQNHFNFIDTSYYIKTFDFQNNKIIVGGDFTSLESIVVNNIARLHFDTTCYTTVTNFDTLVCDSVFYFNNSVYTTSGAFQVILSSSCSADSIVNFNLMLNNVSIDTSIFKQGVTLSSFELNGDNYIWFNCNTNQIVDSTNTDFYVVQQPGSYALEITKNGCKDTSFCFTIQNQDFYSLPNYSPLEAEAFAMPVSTIDSCDAIVYGWSNGGFPPYYFDWYTQVNNNNSVDLFNACEGFHILKVTDIIGDSVLIDYYVTDSTNWYNLADSLNYSDTIYLSDENCSLNYGVPIDSAYLIEFNFLSSINSGDYYSIGILYFQLGNSYIYNDTILLQQGNTNILIDFSVFCPQKSTSRIKTLILDFDLSYASISNLNSFNYTISIYPNPSTGHFTISTPVKDLKIEIFSIDGKMVKNALILKDYSQEIDISHVKSGVYFINIYNDKYVKTIRVVKE